MGGVVRGGGTKRVVVASVVAAIVTIVIPSGAAHAAGGLDAAAEFLLNDSPMYTFAGTGAPPTRNVPAAVASVAARGKRSGIDLELRQLARFVPDDQPITARITFYGRRGNPSVAGGFEFLFMTGSATVETTLVERATEGTPTSPEVWEEADEDFGDATGEYTPEGATLSILATGSYRRLLRDPYTAVGLDLLIGAPGTSVQPSARVSIGDLTGARPGLVARQGTGIGDDGTPEPWITLRYAGEFAGFRIAAAVERDRATVDVGKLADSASQIRLFTASPFAAGTRFDGYELLLFAPTETSVRARSGDAFDAVEVGPVSITPGQRTGRFSLEFVEPLRGDRVAVQVVVPGETSSVLLATGFHVKF